MDDDFSPDEIKDFEGVSDEEKRAIERYTKWASKKASAGPPSGAPSKNDTSPSGEQKSSTETASPSQSALGLKDLINLVQDDQTSSILEHLLAKKAELQRAAPKPGAPKPSLPGAKGLTRLLK